MIYGAFEMNGSFPFCLCQFSSIHLTHYNCIIIDADSPITSPRDKNVTFGGYSPSVGGANERPITAPSRRSVRFADELGFDELDFSLNDSRPSTAPESGQTKKPNRLKDATIGSSFEEENTDISLDLSTSEFKRPSTPNLKTAGMLSLSNVSTLHFVWDFFMNLDDV